jgi:tripartite-type tricarboxylate transporter receptor subunit TctC
MQLHQRVLLGLLGLFAPIAGAAADEVADFYKGRTITVTAASGAGGGYGVYALTIADHIGKHIPGNPNVIVNYNPSAGGFAAAEYVYNIAPKDGTAVLAPLQSLPTQQAVGMSGIRFDVTKLNWIGRAAEATSGFVVRAKAVASLEALLARSEETVVGITHFGAPNHILPALLSYCPGVRMKLVSGYPGSAPLALAIQRAEVDGVSLPLDSFRSVYPKLLEETVIAQSGLKRARDLAHVPLASELCKDAAKQPVVEFFQVQEEMGRSYALAPGTPPARVAALRAAFEATMKDPAFLAAAKARRIDINPLTGAEVQRLVERHLGSEPALIVAAKGAVGLK